MTVGDGVSESVDEVVGECGSVSESVGEVVSVGEGVRGARV